MKCDIIRDLIPLCSEGLCSEESCKEIEEHIQSCENCRLLYEKIPIAEEGSSESVPNEDKALKKVNKKFRKNKLLTIFLIIILASVIFFLGFLTFNEITKVNDMSFSTIFRSLEARKIANYIIEGDAESYVWEMFKGDVVFEYGESGDEFVYNQEIKNVKEAYDKYISGKDFYIEDIYSQYYPANYFSPQGSLQFTTHYMVTNIIITSADETKRYKFSFTKDEQNRWKYNSVTDLHNAASQAGYELNRAYDVNRPEMISYGYPEGWLESEDIEIESKVRLSIYRFDDSYTEIAKESLTEFFEAGFLFDSVEFSQAKFDEEQERFYFDAVFIAHDDKGRAVLKMPIYLDEYFDYDGWIPSSAEEHEVISDSCSDELTEALQNLLT